MIIGSNILKNRRADPYIYIYKDIYIYIDNNFIVYFFVTISL